MKTLRQLEILSILMSDSNFFSSEYISKQVNVTYKTIQTDINDLLESLKMFPGIKIISKRGYGYKIEFDNPQDFENFRAEYEFLSEIRGEQNQAGYIVLDILFNNDTLEENYIYSILDIDKKILQSVLKKLNNEAEPYGLSFVSKKGLLYLIGQEQAKRMFFIHYYQLIKNNKLIMSELELNLDYKSKMKDVQISGRITSNEDATEYLKVFSVISDYRNKNGFTDDSVNDQNRIFDLLLWHVEFIHYFDINIEYNVLSDIHTEVDRFINQRISKSLNLFDDNAFAVEYLSKIVSIIKEQNELYYFPDINMNLFDFDDFQIALELANHLMIRLHNGLKLKFGRNHLFVLAKSIYLISNSNAFRKDLSIIIYGSKNKANANLLEKYLIREFKDRLNVRVVDSFPNMDVFNIHNNPSLFITDTESVIDLSKGYFALHHEDLTDVKYIKPFIEANISKYYVRRREVIEMFDESRFSPNYNITNMGDVINYVGSKYIKDESRIKITERFVFMRERHFFSVVTNGLAAPRMYVDEHIAKPKIEVIIPKDSFYWNDQIIKIIFVIVIPRSFEGIGVLGIPFESFMSKKAVVNRLAECRDYKEFLQTIGEQI